MGLTRYGYDSLGSTLDALRGGRGEEGRERGEGREWRGGSGGEGRERRGGILPLGSIRFLLDFVAVGK